jgi:hypothetical protein
VRDGCFVAAPVSLSTIAAWRLLGANVKVVRVELSVPQSRMEIKLESTLCTT